LWLRCDKPQPWGMAANNARLAPASNWCCLRWPIFPVSTTGTSRWWGEASKVDTEALPPMSTWVNDGGHHVFLCSRCPVTGLIPRYGEGSTGLYSPHRPLSQARGWVQGWWRNHAREVMAAQKSWSYQNLGHGVWPWLLWMEERISPARRTPPIGVSSSPSTREAKYEFPGGWWGVRLGGCWRSGVSSFRICREVAGDPDNGTHQSVIQANTARADSSWSHRHVGPAGRGRARWAGEEEENEGVGREVKPISVPYSLFSISISYFHFPFQSYVWCINQNSQHDNASINYIIIYIDSFVHATKHIIKCSMIYVKYITILFS
jgi:hypothetical protein